MILYILVSLIAFFLFGHLAFFSKISLKNEDVHKFFIVLTIISLIYFLGMSILFLIKSFEINLIAVYL
jgi:uncharacterized membrane protein